MARLLWLWLWLLLIVGGSHAESAPKGKPLVVATVHPLALMARDLAGDWLRVEPLLAAGQEPHHVVLSLSQRRLLEGADLVLWVGPEMETFLVKILRTLDSDRQLSFRDSGGASDSHDPHYWLHPELAADYYRALAQRLSERFPERAPQIAARLTVALAALDKASSAIKEKLAAAPAAKVIVDHQAYGHFARHYRLAVAGALVDESGVAAGPRTVAGLYAQAGVSCVVVERAPGSRSARKLAAALQVPVVAIDPLGSDTKVEQGFVGVLVSVADGFERCLSLQ